MPPPLDPNWFYSTLAQSAAAIVGLVGGFIGSRIVEQIGRIIEEREKMIKILTSDKHAVNGFGSTARSYRRYLEEEIKLNEETLSKGIGERHINHWLTMTSSGGGSRTIYISQTLIDRQLFICPYLLRCSDLVETIQFPGILGPKSKEIVTALIILSRELEKACIEQNIPKDSEEVAGLLNGLVNIAAINLDSARIQYLSYLDRMIPKHFYVGLVILGFISLAGIVAPLNFLSAADASSKMLLMALFSFGLVLLFGFLAYQLYYLRRLGEITLV